MTGSQLREHLRDGSCVFGTHITSLPNPNVTMMAGAMDLDFAFFCTEHLPLDRNEISLLCRFYAAQCGISPIVRVPAANDIAAMAMVLDAGAEGIIAPYIETEYEVRQAAAVVRHRPIKGRFLQEIQEGKRQFSQKTQNYIQNFNRNNYLIIGIESVPAIDNLEALITAAEVDAVFLGPHDISTSMGIPEEYGHPDFVQTIEGVIRRCRSHNVGVGIHLPLMLIEPAILERYLNVGMNFLINGTDITILRDAMNTQIEALKAMTKTPNRRELSPKNPTETKLQTCLV